MKRTKRLLALLLMLILCVGEISSTGLKVFAAGDWTGEGSGTASDPYKIGSKEQLEKFRDIVNGMNGETKNTAACAELTADIVLDDAWIPIADSSSGKYAGSFDGKYHSVKNATEEDLFEYLGTDGGIRNLGDYEGGYVVYNNAGIIENCTIKGSGRIAYENSGTVTGCSTTTIPGLVIRNLAGGTVSLCINTAKIAIAGDKRAAGIVDYNIGTVEKCINTGDVIVGFDSEAGGIVRENYGTIRNCLNTGMVNDRAYGASGHGIACDNWGSSYKIENCLSLNSDISGGSDADKMINNYCTVYEGNATVITQEQLNEQSTFRNFDFVNVWIMGDNGPTLRNINGHIHSWSVEAERDKAVVKCTVSDCPYGTNEEYKVSISYNGKAGIVTCDKEPMPPCVGGVGYPVYSGYPDAIPHSPGKYTARASVGDKYISIDFEIVTDPLASGEYTVHFETNGGSSVADEYVFNGDKAIKPSDPTKYGENFGGWFKDSEFITPFDFDTPITEDTTIYAKWGDGVSYTVTFDMNGHGDAIDAVSVNEGKIVTEPAEPKAEGYIFGGWYTSADCKDTEKYDFDTAVTRDITLYAKWTGVERTVSFDANGQTATEMPEAQKVENGKTAAAPDKEPAAEGFKFAGWYTSKECKDEEAYDFTKAVTGDITLYAKWEETSAENYTVTFDLNGVSGNAPEAQTVEAGKAVSKPADPKAEGFVFKTWCTDNAGEKEYDFTAPVSANFTLYAKWEKSGEDGPGPGPVVIGKSSLDPVPELVPGKTKDLYLVKGQKFNIDQGWYIDKADKESKRKVSISNKGIFKAKSEGEAGIKSGYGDTAWEVKVHISKPKMGKTLKLQLETDKEVKSEQLQFEYDKNLKVLWYSANPDVVTVDNTGKVTTVGKGTSKVTAYINGSAYSCMVKVTEKEPLLNRTLHVAKGSSKSISIKGLKNAEWEDSVKDIVSVQNNKVKGLNAGTTELSVSQNGKAYKVNVIVEDLTMKGTGLRTQGKTGSNKYIIDELKANDKTKLSFEGVIQPVVFKSSKPEVAVIDENLNVEIRGRGRTKFTAKVNGKTVTITVNAK